MREYNLTHNEHSITAMVHYLVKDNRNKSIIKIRCLMFLSEKKHLCYYGRPISRKVAISLKTFLIYQNNDYDLDWLSDSDIQVMDEILLDFNDLSDEEIRKIVFRYPEGQKFFNLNEECENVDLFSCLKDDPLGLEHETVKFSRVYYEGMEDDEQYFRDLNLLYEGDV